MTFIITIDTEGDNQWDPSLPRSTDNLRFLPRFQALCDRYEFPPTYLCTYDVVESPLFDEVLLPGHRERRAEIGAHLHPWTTPPLSSWDRTETAFAYPSELPAGVFARKLERLTALLAAKLGAPPQSYRAGRWGLSAAHIPILLQCGYRVDCSVTPLLNWTDRGARERGQDFSEAPQTPYFMSWGDPAREGSSGLLEVPVTILHTSAIMRESPIARAMYRRYRKTRPARVLNRMFRIAPQWFRPFSDMSVPRLKAVYHTARQLELPVIEMMFHSSELMPSGSPHNLTPGAVDHVYGRLDEIFSHLAAEQVKGSTLAAFAETVRRGPVGAADELTWAPGRNAARSNG